MSKAREVIAEMLSDLDGNTDAYAANADDIIDALREAGLVVVPVEPTFEMIGAAMGPFHGRYAARTLQQAIRVANKAYAASQEDKG